LAIAGLIEDKVRTQINSLPGISKLPILGALFRSRDFVHSQTELLILVTPVLAQVGGPIELPTDKLTFAGDAEAIFLGHIEKLYGVGSGGEGEYQGSIGFVLD
jgi:pilus assembly protein CpaC